MHDRRIGWIWVLLAFAMAVGAGVAVSQINESTDITLVVFLVGIAFWALLRGFAAFSRGNDGASSGT